MDNPTGYAAKLARFIGGALSTNRMLQAESKEGKFPMANLSVASLNDINVSMYCAQNPITTNLLVS